MKIGDVSLRMGIPASTIRYYERIGLIPPPRRVSGWREFDHSTISAIRFVQFTQAAGFSIAEIRSLLGSSSYDRGSVEIWKEAAKAKHLAVRGKIRDLKKMEGFLARLTSCECPTLNDCINSTCHKMNGAAEPRSNVS